MYVLKPGIKKDPQRRWALPDRIFFGHGACHILAGAYLARPPHAGFHPERIIPHDGLPGFHVFVTDGLVAFDYHGYCLRRRLLDHHARSWARQHAGWAFKTERVAFNLLDTGALNAHKMLGPDQYLHNAQPRADAFLRRIDHRRAYKRALELTQEPADGMDW